MVHCLNFILRVFISFYVKNPFKLTLLFFDSYFNPMSYSYLTLGYYNEL